MPRWPITGWPHNRLDQEGNHDMTSKEPEGQATSAEETSLLEDLAPREEDAGKLMGGDDWEARTRR